MDGVAGEPKSPHDRSMDARIAVLEEIFGFLKDSVGDLRQEARETSRRLDEMRSDTNRRLDEMRVGTDRRFDEMRSDADRRFDDTNRKFDAMRDDMDRRFDAMRGAQERDFRILFSALITTALGLAALMAKGFHWF